MASSAGPTKVNVLHAMVVPERVGHRSRPPAAAVQVTWPCVKSCGIGVVLRLSMLPTVPHEGDVNSQSRLPDDATVALLSISYLFASGKRVPLCFEGFCFQ